MGDLDARHHHLVRLVFHGPDLHHDLGLHLDPGRWGEEKDWIRNECWSAKKKLKALGRANCSWRGLGC